MMRIPKSVQSLIESFEKLPGIGPKTAQRLTYYLLHVPQTELDVFAKAVGGLKKNTSICSVCKNVDESDPCAICREESRDRQVIMVVEQPLDAVAFERTGKYRGLYHVLHGRISPLENIGPDEIYVEQLLDRVKGRESKRVKEIIIATNPTMEGDATAMYLAKRVKELESGRVKVTRLGMGIPTGADLEYADDVTLTQALEGRKDMGGKQE